jgi:hypothetical protein
MNDLEKYTGNKSFNLTLINPINTTLGSCNAQINIIDTDSLTYTISASQTVINEADTSITLTVRKNIASDYSSNVTITTVDETAISGSDYDAINQVLTFNASELIKTVVLSIKADNLVEDVETFKVVLSSPTGNATLGSPYEIEIRILPIGAGGNPNTLFDFVKIAIIGMVLAIIVMGVIVPVLLTTGNTGGQYGGQYGEQSRGLTGAGIALIVLVIAGLVLTIGALVYLLI